MDLEIKGLESLRHMNCVTFRRSFHFFESSLPYVQNGNTEHIEYIHLWEWRRIRDKALGTNSRIPSISHDFPFHDNIKIATITISSIKFLALLTNLCLCCIYILVVIAIKKGPTNINETNIQRNQKRPNFNSSVQPGKYHLCVNFLVHLLYVKDHAFC